MFSSVNITFSQLVTKPCFKSTTCMAHINILEFIDLDISFTDEYSRCAPCVIKSAIRHRIMTGIHIEISRRIGIIFGGHKWDFPPRREKVNKLVLISNRYNLNLCLHFI